MRILQRCDCGRVYKPMATCKCGHTLNKNDVWLIEYAWEGKRKKETIGKDAYRLAKIRGAEIERMILEKRYLSVNKNATATLGKIIDWYLALPEIDALNSIKHRSAYLLKTAETLGKSLPISELSPDSVIDSRRSRPDLSPATYNRELAYLKACLNKAVAYGKLEYNPIAHVKLLEENNHRDVRFTEDELRHLLSVCEETVKPIVSVAFYSMMRMGEILGLVWEEVDLSDWVIRLPRNRTKAKRDRVVPIVPEIRDIFMSGTRGIGLKRVFKNSEYSGTYFSKLFSKAVKTADLDITFHDLRHASAQWFYKKGYGIVDIMKIGGWEDFSTLKRYLFNYSDTEYAIKMG